MLGQFLYSPQILDECVVIEMRWEDRGAIGALHIPPRVSELVAGSELEHIKSGESMMMPIALGIGIIFAALAETTLVLSGERSAWKESWGALLERPGAVE
jgi:hypothetical protein